MWELDYKESWAPKNWCFWTVVLEKTLESPLDCKEIQPVHYEGDQPWVFFGRNDAKAESLVLWPPHVKSWLIGKDWCWEGLGAGGEEDNRGWDGWMALLTQWTWVWVNSGSWWWTGRPGVLWFMGSQRVGHDWVTELNWTDLRSRKNKCHYHNLLEASSQAKYLENYSLGTRSEVELNVMKLPLLSSVPDLLKLTSTPLLHTFPLEEDII